METAIDIPQLLIYIHASFGGIALLSGTLAILFKKGSPNHKKAGKIFYLSLLIGSLIAIGITQFPNHYNPFLFSIGIFSLYLLLSGYRALRYKAAIPSLKIDTMISSTMLLISLLMISLPLLQNGKLNIVLSVFGGIGLFSAIRDLRFYQNPEKLRKNWLRLHLGNMMGAYIASFTAFIVVNDFLPSLVGWLGPTVLGFIYIIYWNRKLKKKKKKATI